MGKKNIQHAVIVADGQEYRYEDFSEGYTTWLLTTGYNLAYVEERLEYYLIQKGYKDISIIYDKKRRDDLNEFKNLNDKYCGC